MNRFDIILNTVSWEKSFNKSTIDIKDIICIPYVYYLIDIIKKTMSGSGEECCQPKKKHLSITGSIIDVVSIIASWVVYIHTCFLAGI